MIYLDANVIIRMVEGSPAVRAPIEKRLGPVGGVKPGVLTSVLSRIECRCKPMASAERQVLARYDVFFTAADVRLIDVDAAVIEKTTELRARLNVKTPDAIHLATAITAGASAFLTADKDLARCKDVAVEVM